MSTQTTRTGGKAPCGFCHTGHHDLCPGTIRNGSQAAHPTWTCPCSLKDHTLGGPHRVTKIERLSPTVLAPRSVVDVDLPADDDLDHMCVTASCLAHRRRVWTGGDSREWRHQDNRPCQRTASARPAATTTRRPARTSTTTDVFPAGVIAPVAFRHLLVAEGLAPESFRKQTVYTWVTQTERGGAFPVRWYGPDGTEHQTRQPDTRPGVLVDEARDWFRSQQAA